MRTQLGRPVESLQGGKVGRGVRVDQLHVNLGLERCVWDIQVEAFKSFAEVRKEKEQCSGEQKNEESESEQE